MGILKDYLKLKAVLPFKKKNPGRGKVGIKAVSLSDVQKAFRVFALERRCLSIVIVELKSFRFGVASLEIDLNIMML